MTQAVETMVDALLVANGEQVPVSSLPQVSLADGYRVQAAVFERRGLSVGGWKVALVDGTPVAAPLAATTIHSSGVQLQSSEVCPLLVETELAVRLGRDLPKRTAWYERDDVLAAIDTIHAAFEVVSPRVGQPPATPFPVFLADGLGNAATVVGPGAKPQGWPTVAVLEQDSAIVARGAHPAGDPLAALQAWANQPADALGGLCRGHLVLLGSFTGVLPVPGTGRTAFRGLFAGLEPVDVVFIGREHA